MPGTFEHIEQRLPAPERRTCSRQPVRSLAYVELDEGNGGIVLNVSEGGLSVQAVMSLMEDALPQMRFQLSESKGWLETSARIAWTNESRKVAGLQFVDPSEKIRLQIREWLAREAVLVGVTSDEHQGPAQVYDHENGKSGKGPAAPDATSPAASASPTFSYTPSTHTSEQTSEFKEKSKSELPQSGSHEVNRSDRAWNLAGVAALLAIASLAAGWIAGRRTFSGPGEKTSGTASPASVAQADATQLSSAATEPISEIEIVDTHNQRWMIPFNPTTSGNQTNTNAGRQTKPQGWPAFNPAAAPEIQSRTVADDADSQNSNPPVVAAPSDNAGSILLQPESADSRNLTPPETKAGPPTSVLKRGALIYHVDPVYPEMAKQQQIQGTVKLQVTIGENGAVRSVIAVGGPGMLIEAARSAVRQWRYTPSLLDGKPIESQEDVSIVFQLPSVPR